MEDELVHLHTVAQNQMIRIAYCSTIIHVNIIYIYYNLSQSIL